MMRKDGEWQYTSSQLADEMAKADEEEKVGPSGDRGLVVRLEGREIGVDGEMVMLQDSRGSLVL